MPLVTAITVSQLSRLIGLPQSPALVDVRIDDDYRADPRLLPGSVRRDFRTSEQWATHYRGKSVVVVCQKGQKLSEGTAAWLRHGGIEAQTLEGGFEAWKKAGELLVRTDKLPARDEKGQTVWVSANALRLVVSAGAGLAAVYWLGLGVSGFCAAVAAGFVLYAVLLLYTVLRVRNPDGSTSPQK